MPGSTKAQQREAASATSATRGSRGPAPLDIATETSIQHAISTICSRREFVTLHMLLAELREAGIASALERHGHAEPFVTVRVIHGIYVLNNTIELMARAVLAVNGLATWEEVETAIVRRLRTQMRPRKDADHYEETGPSPIEFSSIDELGLGHILWHPVLQELFRVPPRVRVTPSMARSLDSQRVFRHIFSLCECTQEEGASAVEARVVASVAAVPNKELWQRCVTCLLRVDEQDDHFLVFPRKPSPFRLVRDLLRAAAMRAVQDSEKEAAEFAKAAAKAKRKAATPAKHTPVTPGGGDVALDTRHDADDDGMLGAAPGVRVEADEWHELLHEVMPSARRIPVGELLHDALRYRTWYQLQKRYSSAVLVDNDTLDVSQEPALRYLKGICLRPQANLTQMFDELQQLPFGNALSSEIQALCYGGHASAPHDIMRMLQEHFALPAHATLLSELQLRALQDSIPSAARVPNAVVYSTTLDLLKCTIDVSDFAPDVLDALTGVPLLEDVATWTSWPVVYASRFGPLVQYLCSSDVACACAERGSRFVVESHECVFRIPAHANTAMLSEAIQDGNATQIAALLIAMLTAPTTSDPNASFVEQHHMRSTVSRLALEVCEGKSTTYVGDALVRAVLALPARWLACIGSSLLHVVVTTLGASLAFIFGNGVSASARTKIGVAATAARALQLISPSAAADVLAAMPYKPTTTVLPQASAAAEAVDRIEPIAPSSGTDDTRERVPDLWEDAAAPPPSQEPQTPLSDVASSGADAFLESAEKSSNRPETLDAAKLVVSLLRDEWLAGRGRRDHRVAVSATHRLAAELYQDASHFLYEMLQNCDDNEYAPGVAPEACMTLRARTDPPELIVFNNERGFRYKDVVAICQTGGSTKLSSTYIGKKGIGWKSVFGVSLRPEVHSGFIHLVQDSRPPPDGLGALGQLAPTWLEPDSPSEFFVDGTRFVLRIGEDSTRTIPVGRVRDALSHLADTPELLLFLRRLSKLSVVMDDATAVIHRHKDVVLAGSDSGFAVHIASVTVGSTLKRWLVCTMVSSLSDAPPNVVAVAAATKQTSASLAFPLTESSDDPLDARASRRPNSQLLFSFLPVDNYGWPFIVQADWVLPSTRESVRQDSPWNEWVAWCLVPAAFARVLAAIATLYDVRAPRHEALVDNKVHERCALAASAFLRYMPLKDRMSPRAALLAGAARRIRDSVRELPCVLTWDGKWQKPSRCVRCPPHLSRESFTRLLADCCQRDAFAVCCEVDFVSPAMRVADDVWNELGVPLWTLHNTVAFLAAVYRHECHSVADVKDRFVSWARFLTDTAPRDFSGQPQWNAISEALRKCDVAWIPTKSGSLLPASAFLVLSPSSTGGRHADCLTRCLRDINSRQEWIPVLLANRESMADWLLDLLNALNVTSFSLDRAQHVECIHRFFCHTNLDPSAVVAADAAVCPTEPVHVKGKSKTRKHVNMGQLDNPSFSVAPKDVVAAGQLALLWSQHHFQPSQADLMAALRARAVWLTASGHLTHTDQAQDAHVDGIPRVQLHAPMEWAGERAFTLLEQVSLCVRRCDIDYHVLSNEYAKAVCPLGAYRLGIATGLHGLPLRLSACEQLERPKPTLTLSENCPLLAHALEKLCTGTLDAKRHDALVAVHKLLGYIYDQSAFSMEPIMMALRSMPCVPVVDGDTNVALCRPSDAFVNCAAVTSRLGNWGVYAAPLFVERAAATAYAQALGISVTVSEAACVKLLHRLYDACRSLSSGACVNLQTDASAPRFITTSEASARLGSTCCVSCPFAVQPFTIRAEPGLMLRLYQELTAASPDLPLFVPWHCQVAEWQPRDDAVDCGRMVHMSEGFVVHADPCGDGARHCGLLTYYPAGYKREHTLAVYEALKHWSHHEGGELRAWTAALLRLIDWARRAAPDDAVHPYRVAMDLLIRASTPLRSTPSQRGYDEGGERGHCIAATKGDDLQLGKLPVALPVLSLRDAIATAASPAPTIELSLRLLHPRSSTSGERANSVLVLDDCGHRAAAVTKHVRDAEVIVVGLRRALELKLLSIAGAESIEAWLKQSRVFAAVSLRALRASPPEGPSVSALVPPTLRSLWACACCIAQESVLQHQDAYAAITDVCREAFLQVMDPDRFVILRGYTDLVVPYLHGSQVMFTETRAARIAAVPTGGFGLFAAEASLQHKRYVELCVQAVGDFIRDELMCASQLAEDSVLAMSQALQRELDEKLASAYSARQHILEHERWYRDADMSLPTVEAGTIERAPVASTHNSLPPADMLSVKKRRTALQQLSAAAIAAAAADHEQVELPAASPLATGVLTALADVETQRLNAEVQKRTSWSAHTESAVTDAWTRRMYSALHAKAADDLVEPGALTTAVDDAAAAADSSKLRGTVTDDVQKPLGTDGGHTAHATSVNATRPDGGTSLPSQPSLTILQELEAHRSPMIEVAVTPAPALQPIILNAPMKRSIVALSSFAEELCMRHLQQELAQENAHRAEDEAARELVVIWMNQHKEFGHPFDIVVVEVPKGRAPLSIDDALATGGAVARYVEVKSTTTSEWQFILSWKELRFAADHAGLYELWLLKMDTATRTASMLRLPCPGCFTPTSGVQLVLRIPTLSGPLESDLAGNLVISSMHGASKTVRRSGEELAAAWMPYLGRITPDKPVLLSFFALSLPVELRWTYHALKSEAVFAHVRGWEVRRDGPAGAEMVHAVKAMQDAAAHDRAEVPHDTEVETQHNRATVSADNSDRARLTNEVRLSAGQLSPEQLADAYMPFLVVIRPGDAVSVREFRDRLPLDMHPSHHGTNFAAVFSYISGWSIRPDGPNGCRIIYAATSAIDVAAPAVSEQVLTPIAAASASSAPSVELPPSTRVTVAWQQHMQALLPTHPLPRAVLGLQSAQAVSVLPAAADNSLLHTSDAANDECGPVNRDMAVQPPAAAVDAVPESPARNPSATRPSLAPECDTRDAKSKTLSPEQLAEAWRPYLSVITPEAPMTLSTFGSALPPELRAKAHRTSYERVFTQLTGWRLVNRQAGGSIIEAVSSAAEGASIAVAEVQQPGCDSSIARAPATAAPTPSPSLTVSAEIPAAPVATTIKVSSAASAPEANLARAWQPYLAVVTRDKPMLHSAFGSALPPELRPKAHRTTYEHVFAHVTGWRLVPRQAGGSIIEALPSAAVSAQPATSSTLHSAAPAAATNMVPTAAPKPPPIVAGPTQAASAPAPVAAPAPAPAAAPSRLSAAELAVQWQPYLARVPAGKVLLPEQFEPMLPTRLRPSTHGLSFQKVLAHAPGWWMLSNGKPVIVGGKARKAAAPAAPSGTPKTTPAAPPPSIVASAHGAAAPKRSAAPSSSTVVTTSHGAALSSGPGPSRRAATPPPSATTVTPTVTAAAAAPSAVVATPECTAAAGASPALSDEELAREWQPALSSVPIGGFVLLETFLAGLPRHLLPSAHGTTAARVLAHMPSFTLMPLGPKGAQLLTRDE